jgi:diacylglycerol kinase (ATP)
MIAPMAAKQVRIMSDRSPEDPSASRGPRGRPRVLLIHNPTSGSWNARRLDRFLKPLTAGGTSIDVRRTRKGGDARALAAEIAPRDAGVVAVAGGDGTINEVVNGLAAVTLPVAVLPLGTANVLAAELGIPARPSRLARCIREGATTDVYLPRANGRRFTMMVGVGFDAHVVADVSCRLKHLFGRTAYLLAVAKMFRKFPYRFYEVIIDGRAYRAASAVIANGHYYAGRLTCAPDARLDDPDLHVCLFLRSGRWSTLRYGLSLLLGRLHRRSDVMILRGRTVEVRGHPGEPVQCDGDLTTTLPLTVNATEEKLRFLTFRLPACGNQRPATVIPSMRTVGESTP